MKQAFTAEAKTYRDYKAFDHRFLNALGFGIKTYTAAMTTAYMFFSDLDPSLKITAGMFALGTYVIGALLQATASSDLESVANCREYNNLSIQEKERG